MCTTSPCCAVGLYSELSTLTIGCIQVAYQRILQLTYVDDLLGVLKTLFIKLFEPFLATFVASLHAINSRKAVSAATQWDFSKAFEGWDKIFDKVLKGLEDKAAQVGPYIARCMNAIL